MTFDMEVRAWEGREEGSKGKLWEGKGRKIRGRMLRVGVGCGSLRPWQGVAFYWCAHGIVPASAMDRVVEVWCPASRDPGELYALSTCAGGHQLLLPPDDRGLRAPHRPHGESRQDW